MTSQFSRLIRDTAQGSIILILGKIASTIIGALGAIIVARLLGSTSFGLISIALIPVNIAMMLINNGVTSAIINYIVENKQLRKEEKINSIVLSGFIINITIGLGTTLLLYVFSAYIAVHVFGESDLIHLIRILSLSVFAHALYSTSAAVLIGFERMTQRSFVDILYQVLKTIIGPLLVYLGYGIIGASYGYSIPHLITGLFALILIYLILGKSIKTTKIVFEDFRNILSYSGPLFFSNILSGSLNQLLNFILPFYVSATLIGNYSAAVYFNVLISFFTVPIATASFPLYSKLSSEDPVFEEVFQNIIKYKTMITYPVAAVIFALSNHLVGIVYGNDYQYTAFFVQILMLNYLFVGFGFGETSNLLNSQKKTVVMLRRTLIYLAFGIPLGLILIPRYGVVGFLFTTILAPKVGLLYALWWIRKNMNVNLDIGTTLRILSSAVIGFITCFLVISNINLNQWFEVVFGVVGLATSYVLSILISGALTKSNISDIYVIVSQYGSIQWLIKPFFKILNMFARKD